jgi:hypothetical protein
MLPLAEHLDIQARLVSRAILGRMSANSFPHRRAETSHLATPNLELSRELNDGTRDSAPGCRQLPSNRRRQTPRSRRMPTVPLKACAAVHRRPAQRSQSERLSRRLLPHHRLAPRLQDSERRPRLVIGRPAPTRTRPATSLPLAAATTLPRRGPMKMRAVRLALCRIALCQSPIH